MNKFFKRVLVGAFALIGLGAFAQQMPQLPQDPDLVYGVLDNGLTYYIRHNEKPRGQADFYIAQKVGSILEDENQRGLAHFLEHMCFNGTQNFPEKGIINYLESVGVKFGYNLNAYTSIDETVYNISSVPTARTGVQDSCLLILHDWACALTLADNEIDAERGVIHEEWRRSMVGQMRILENALPKLYPGNKYGERLPIGTMDVVDHFDYQTLKDYYHKWYRPDQQAIIVVGDVDVAYIENKIKEIFAPILMPVDAAKREYLTVEDNTGTLYAVGSDPEQTIPVALMFFKSDDILVPRELRNTPAWYVSRYINNMVTLMMNQRLSDLATKPECKFAQADISLGDYLISSTKGALELDVVAKGNDITGAVAEAYREILRADRGGFTVSEFERAKAEFLSQVDQKFQSRNDRENETFSRAYVENFTEGVPAPQLELEKQLYDQFAQVIGLEVINQYFQELITPDNRALLVMMPQKEGFTAPTEEQLATALNSVDAETIEAYKDEMRTDPLIPSLPAPGSIVSTTEDTTWGATVYTLSNGVKVYVKPTAFKANEIVFEAIAKGKGESELDYALAPTIRFAPFAQSYNGLNDYSHSDIDKYLAGKQLSLDFDYSAYTRSLSGTTTATDLPTFMEILYATFTGYTINEQDFEAAKATANTLLANQENDPQHVWLREVFKDLYSNPFSERPTHLDAEAADREALIATWHNMLANAADYDFVFVGDIKPETFVPLMEQYIATLPASASDATTTYEHKDAFELNVGPLNHVEKLAMETPQTWAFIVVDGVIPYTARNKALASIANQILSKRLLDRVREEMGATYSIGAGGNLSRTGRVNALTQIAFPMKPEQQAEVLSEVHRIVNEMAQNVKAEELNPVLEFMSKDADESLEKNDEWASAIVSVSLNGVQTFTNAKETYANITVDDVMDYMRQLLEQGNYRVTLLEPATAE